jgi:hypothetical protein
MPVFAIFLRQYGTDLPGRSNDRLRQTNQLILPWIEKGDPGGQKAYGQGFGTA